MPFERIVTIKNKSLTLRQIIYRGMKRQCPQCGTPGLFLGYLKIAPRCSSCHLDFNKIRSDDAPAYFTIMIVGHVVVPLVFTVGIYYDLALWLQMIFWPLLTIFLTLILLPFVKGIIMAILWKVRA